MGGLIGVVAQETARYSMFGASMTELDVPEGTIVKWRFGHHIADSTNALIQEMYDRDLDWLWIMGDDHSFSPNLLTSLLDRDVEIVVPVCLMRNPPYRPVAFDYAGAENESVRVNLTDHPDGGLIEVKSCGSAGMLIRREVFDFVERPWFEAGRGITAIVGEDLNFCDKAREAGFDIHLDLDHVLGHCMTGVVWPVREEDGWTFGFSMMGGFQITMPPAASWAYADEVGA